MTFLHRGEWKITKSLACVSLILSEINFTGLKGALGYFLHLAMSEKNFPSHFCPANRPSQKWTGNDLCAIQAKLETILATLC